MPRVVVVKSFVEIKQMLDSCSGDLTRIVPTIGDFSRELSLDHLRTLVSIYVPEQRLQLTLRYGLVEILIRRKEAEAYVWATQLLDKIPSADRDCQYYNHSINIAIDQSKIVRADNLLSEAINKQIDGDIGAHWLMRRDILAMRWTEAANLLYKIEDFSKSNQTSMRVSSLFSSLDNGKVLDERIQNLSVFRSGHGQARSSEFAHLHGRLLARAVQLIETATTMLQYRGMTRSMILRVEQIVELGLLQPKPFEILLRALLKSTSTNDRKMLTNLFARIWLIFSEKCQGEPTPQLLIGVLKAWKSESLSYPIELSSKREPLTANLVESLWRRNLNEPTYVARILLMIIYGRNQESAEIQRLADEYVVSCRKNSIPIDPDFAWPLVDVYAKNGFTSKALSAFEKIEKDYRITPGARLWDLLLHGYNRADDIEGALMLWQKRLASKVDLTSQTFGIMMNLYAKQGIPGIVREFLDLAKVKSIPITAHMMNTMIVANVTAGDSKQALHMLEETINEHQAGKVSGSLTICFNTILSMYSHQRDFSSLIKVHDCMLEMNVKLDSDSFGSICVCLCMRRQAQKAWKVLSEDMLRQRVMPTAFHYTTIMMGYLRLGDYDYAIKVYRHMQKAGVESDASCQAVYFKALARSEYSAKRIVMPRDKSQGMEEVNNSQPLKNILMELMAALKNGSLNDNNSRKSKAKTSLFSTLVELHGQKRCYQAAWELFQTAKDTIDDQSPSVMLITSLMSVYLRIGDHQAVRKCWNLLYDTTIRLRLVTRPDLQASIKLLKDMTVTKTKVSKTANSTNEGPAISAPERYFLSAPFRYLFLSMTQSAVSSQQSIAPAALTNILSTFLSLLTQGFEFDSITWNVLITRLCTMSPPRTLLAFVLTERFLIHSFHGWHQYPGPVSNLTARPNTSRQAEGREYMRPLLPSPAAFDNNVLSNATVMREDKGIYGGRNERVIRYATLVHLASALAKTSRLNYLGMTAFSHQDLNEAYTGFKRDGPGSEDDETSSMNELRSQVGSVQKIRFVAQRTLRAVKSMPFVMDDLQGKLLRR